MFTPTLDQVDWRNAEYGYIPAPEYVWRDGICYSYLVTTPFMGVVGLVEMREPHVWDAYVKGRVVQTTRTMKAASEFLVERAKEEAHVRERHETFRSRRAAAVAGG